jgi:RHS repeat-associated protein
VVKADDPCEASGPADPTGPRKYYRARYYDPKIGRFISEDPLERSHPPKPELNGYAYVANSPVNYRDPMGLQACAICGPGNNIDTERCFDRCLKDAVPPWLKWTLLGIAGPVIAADFPVFAGATAGIAAGGAGYIVGTAIYCEYQCRQERCFQYP